VQEAWVWTACPLLSSARQAFSRFIKVSCGAIFFPLRQISLQTEDSRVRIDAFSFLCESKRPTDPINPDDLDLFLFGLPYSASDQSSGYYLFV
jgi:hypothetical protein